MIPKSLESLFANFSTNKPRLQPQTSEINNNPLLKNKICGFKESMV